MHGNLAMVGLDDVFDDCQPEARPADGAAAGGVDTVEAFEQSGQMLFGDPLAAVLDFDQGLMTVLPGLNSHDSPFEAVFDGIAEQIHHGLFQQRGVDMSNQLR